MINFFTFNGQSSLDFGVTISGGGTFDSPARSMEAVSVPGRNGDLMVDNGRYDNVEITYTAFIAHDFKKNFDAFRAWMLSNPGYHRLEDTYHPEEYREAAFISSLNPEMVGSYCKAGEFEITFNCKPQRFLKSGEEQITFYPTSTVGDAPNSQYMVQNIPVTAGDLCSVTARGLPGTSSQTVQIEFLGASGRPIDTIFKEGTTSTITVQGQAEQSGRIFAYFPVLAENATIAVGNQTYDYVNGGIVFRNRTRYASRPMIQAVSELYSGGDPFSIVVNDTEVSVGEFTPTVSGALTTIIDCENDDVYYNNATSGPVSVNGVTTVTKNGETAPTFPTFQPGDNMIYTHLAESNPIVRYIVTPRWWTI